MKRRPKGPVTTAGAAVWHQSAVDENPVGAIMNARVITRCPQNGKWSSGAVVGIRRDSLEIEHLRTGIRRWVRTCNVYTKVAV